MRFGRLLRRLRAGEERSIWNDADLMAPESITISSESFRDGAPIPRLHAGPGAGENISPELHWSGVPAEAQVTVLWMEDLDAPTRTPLVHTIAVLPAGKTSLAQGSLNAPPADTRLVRASFCLRRYHGPGPIPGHGPHRYRFLLFALSRELTERDLADARSLRRAAAGHVVSRGLTVGTYER